MRVFVLSNSINCFAASKVKYNLELFHQIFEYDRTEEKMKSISPVSSPFDKKLISYMQKPNQWHRGTSEAKRLELQWSKLCEEEKKSQKRNQKLLEDFERVEHHAGVLAAKTQKLKAAKEQYEDYINKMYPRWREQLEYHRTNLEKERNTITNGTSTSPTPSNVIPHPEQQHSLQASLPSGWSGSSHRPPQPNPRGNHHGYGSQFPSVHPHQSHSSVPYGNEAAQYGMQTHPRFHNNGNNSGEFQGGFPYHERDIPQSYYGGGGPPSSSRNHTPSGNYMYERPVSPYDAGLERLHVNSPNSYDPRTRTDAHMYRSHAEGYGYRSQWDAPAGAFNPNQPYERPLLEGHHGTARGRNMVPDTVHKAPEMLDHRSGGVRYPVSESRAELLAQRGPQANGIDAEGLPSAQPGYSERRVYSDDRYGRSGCKDHGAPRHLNNIRQMEGEMDERGRRKSSLEISGGYYKDTQPQGSSSEHFPTKETKQPHASAIRPPQDPPEKPLEQVDVSHQAELPPRSPRLYQAEKDEEHVEQGNSLSDIKTVPDGPRKDSVVKQNGNDTATTTVHLSNFPDQLPLTIDDLKTNTAKSLETEDKGLKSGILETGVTNGQDELGKFMDGVERPEALHKASDNSEQSVDSFSDINLPDGENKRQASVTLARPNLPDKKADESRELSEKSGHRDSVGDKAESVADVGKVTAEEITEDIAASIEDGEAANELEELLAEGFSVQRKEETPSCSEERAPKMSTPSTRQSTNEKEQGSEVLSEEVEDHKESRQSPALSVVVEGFITLLRTVDADVEVSFSPEALYRSAHCTSDIKKDIIKSVNSGNSLDAYEPCTLSMFVLDELPVLVQNSASGCLIPDRAFSGTSTFSKEKKLRTVLEPSLLKLWKSLFAHFVNLIKNIVMMADEVADMFGPLLISSHSVHRKESQTLLFRILKAELTDEDEDSVSESPPTSLRLSPTILHEPNREGNEKASQNALAGSTDHRLSLSSESSDTLESTSPQNDIASEDRRTPEYTLSYEDDVEEEQVPLTETAAYRKMLSIVNSEPMDDDVSDILGESLKSTKNESEADDDVERELARSISPPIASPRQKSPLAPKTSEKTSGGKQRPKLSLFGSGGGSLGVSYGSEDLGDSWGAGESGVQSSSWKSDKSEKSENVSDISDSDSSLTPPLSPGYVPSAVEKEDNKRTEEQGRDERKPGAEKKTATKKPGFWNNSDTESEVDLQLSTGGGLGSDDDDFDFYG